jgi:hypothetical protein
MVGGFDTGAILADLRLPFSCFEGFFAARRRRRPGDFANNTPGNCCRAGRIPPMKTVTSSLPVCCWRAIHLAAAAWHRCVRRDGVTSRMIDGAPI